MRRLVYPHLLAPFPTYRLVRRTFHRAVARAGVAWMLFSGPSVMVSLGAKALLSAKGSYADARFLLSRLSDSVR